MSGNNQYDAFFLNHLQSVKTDSSVYQNLRFLGRGGNGTAFLVTAISGPLSGMQLVLKVFHKISNDTRRKAFLEEVKHLRKADHPAIIKVFDEGTFQASNRAYPFAVVEYQPNTVRQLLDGNEVDRIRAIRITLNCLSALIAIHGPEINIVHRDIKPENILLSQVGAKLADFGLAKSAEAQDKQPQTDNDDDQNHSQWPGMPFRYRSPELIERATGTDVTISGKSDIYQLGTVFYELLTGYNPQRAVDNITRPISLDLREIDGSEGVALYDLISDMLREDPDRRSPATECLERLNRIHRSVCQSYLSVLGSRV